ERTAHLLNINGLNVFPRRRDRVHHRRYLSQQCQAFFLVRRQHGGETFNPIDYWQGRKLSFFAAQFCERISRAERIPRGTVRFLQEPVFPRDGLSAFRLEMQQIIVEFWERRHEYTDEGQPTKAREHETRITLWPMPMPAPVLLHLPCCRTRP